MEYLFAAYMTIWILIFGYILTLGKREKQLQEDIFILKKYLSNNETKS